VQSLLHKKEWFEQRALKKGSNFNSGHFQGKFSLKNDYLEVAESISEVIEIDSNIRRRNQITPSSLWSSLVDKVISKGIWLMRTGVVGNNTHRKLNSDSSKGLALKSTFMPVIWVNSSLSDAPKIYTLIHEMAHLWIDSEGISKQQDEDEIASTNGRSLKEFENLEKFCDLVAAEVLVPAKNLEYLWQSQSSSLDNVENLHKNFGVSRFVIAKRAADLSIVTKSDLANLTVILRQRIKPPIQNEEQEETENSGGGNFYNTLRARNGMEFTKAVVEDAFSGDLLLNAACDLLDIKNSSTLEGAHKFLINKGEL
jgi:Zn-dependent peptidase ImmA (M78 family)